MTEKASPESGPKITITKARPEDATELEEVFYKTWLATYPNEEHGVTKDDIEDRYKDRNLEEKLKERQERIKNLGSNITYLVVRVGDRIAGLCVAEKRGDHNKLRAIYVLSEFQGNKLGQKLWQEVKEFFDPTKDTFVEVAEYNEKAIEFYTKLGFVPTGKKIKDERLRLKSGSIIPEIELVIRAIR